MFETRDTFKDFLKNSNRDVNHVKSSKPLIQRYYEIDIDDCFDTYAFLKKTYGEWATNSILLQWFEDYHIFHPLTVL